MNGWEIAGGLVAYGGSWPGGSWRGVRSRGAPGRGAPALEPNCTPPMHARQVIEAFFKLPSSFFYHLVVHDPLYI